MQYPVLSAGVSPILVCGGLIRERAYPSMLSGKHIRSLNGLKGPSPVLVWEGNAPNVLIPWHVVSSVCAQGDCAHTRSPQRLVAAQRGWRGSNVDMKL